MTDKRPAKQVPAGKPVTKPIDHGPSVWGGRVLQMPPSKPAEKS